GSRLPQFLISNFEFPIRNGISNRRSEIAHFISEIKGRPRGIPCHIGLPDTVASFRTWRGFRAPIARPPKACSISGEPLKRREWNSTPGCSYPHPRFPSVPLNPLETLPTNLFALIKTH